MLRGLSVNSKFNKKYRDKLDKRININSISFIRKKLDDELDFYLCKNKNDIALNLNSTLLNILPILTSLIILDSNSESINLGPQFIITVIVLIGFSVILIRRDHTNKKIYILKKFIKDNFTEKLVIEIYNDTIDMFLKKFNDKRIKIVIKDKLTIKERIIHCDDIIKMDLVNINNDKKHLIISFLENKKKYEI